MTTAVSIVDAAERIRVGSLRVIDLVEASLDAIRERNPELNAFIRIDEDEARARARGLDIERSHNQYRGPLHGIPISIKDLIDIAGQPTTAASRVLHDHIATSDAPVVKRLKDAGAVLIGKTNLHEFALGTTSEDSAFGAVKNPRDHTRSAGGSSGGSAAAVVAGMGLASIGTDTGGSIRIPAAACGIVGLKPTVGEVPTSGIIPLSFSLDHAGPLATSVADAALIWQTLVGATPTTIEPADPKKISLKRLRGHFDGPFEPAVREAFEGALEACRESGINIGEERFDNAHTIPQTYVNLVLAEGGHWHAPFLATRANDYSPTVRARFETGLKISAHDYLTARRERHEWTRTVDAALETADALVLPTLPLLAPVLGATDAVLDERTGESVNVRTAMLRQTQLFNITGHPAISIPIRSQALPVGLQIVGRRGQTGALLAVAAMCERILG